MNHNIASFPGFSFRILTILLALVGHEAQAADSFPQKVDRLLRII